MNFAEAASQLGRFAHLLAGRADPVILMYHRVGYAPIDPWGLAVTPETFAKQMKLLEETRRPVALDWLVEELRAGRQPSRAVAVTFDDAYRDVLENGKPALLCHGIPATVFVVADTIGSDRGYWWDELAQIVLGQVDVPSEISLPFEAPDVTAALRRGDPGELHRALWGSMRLLEGEKQDAVLAAVAEAYGQSITGGAPVMTEAELREITDGGLVHLGVHTRTHPSLPSLSPEAQEAELVGCREVLERLTGEPNGRLAYPFGDYDDTTVRLARRLGFSYAVSVISATATRRSNLFTLPRLDVKNWSDGVFRRKLSWPG